MLEISRWSFICSLVPRLTLSSPAIRVRARSAYEDDGTLLFCCCCIRVHSNSNLYDTRYPEVNLMSTCTRTRTALLLPSHDYERATPLARYSRVPCWYFCTFVVRVLLGYIHSCMRRTRYQFCPAANTGLLTGRVRLVAIAVPYLQKGPAPAHRPRKGLLSLAPRIDTWTIRKDKRTRKRCKMLEEHHSPEHC